MSNSTFFATNITATTTFQNFGTLLGAAGLNISDASVTSVLSYIKNNSASINLYVGTGTSAPTTNYATATPLSAIGIVAGMNVNQVWVASASSTVSLDFVEGGASYTPPQITGVIGTITLTDNTVPKGSSGNLVDSTITDTGSLITLGTTTAVTTEIKPVTNDGAPLGDTTHNFSDLFLASGAVINYANGNVALTQSSGILTMGTGELRITSPGTNAASVPTIGSTNTFTNKTLTAPVINGATSASGNFDLSGSSGTFLSSTGANTLSGSVTVADATTPSVTLASGKTNTGFLLINGKTSGSTKFITADATAQAVVVSTAAQTVGGSTLTIPNQLGVNTSFAFINQYLAAEVTADVTNNTATMANITDLTVTLQAAGVYVGEMVLKCANSTAAEGISVDFDGSAATMTAFACGAGLLTGGTTVAVTTVSSALATDLNWTTITGETWLTFRIGLTVNAAGTFIPRFCEGTAHTSGTATISRGSFLRLQKV